MQVHPFFVSKKRMITTLLLVILAMAVLGGLLFLYGGIPPLAALTDSAAFTGMLAACGILNWFFYAYIRVWQAQVVLALLVQVIGLGACYTTLSLAGLEDAGAFVRLLPLRLTAGLLSWIILMQRYHILQMADAKPEKEREEAGESASAPNGWIDRISVKDSGRIHIIQLSELLYIQANGDYVMLFTSSGRYVKEETMKYFDTHLPSATFVRVHRSTIVNIDQIMRVELFGKENYRIRLKNGTCLKASSPGYKLLKSRLNL
jgi:hypothetical protein